MKRIGMLSFRSFFSNHFSILPVKITARSTSLSLKGIEEKPCPNFNLELELNMLNFGDT